MPDAKYPNMWRSTKALGQLSDLANLSHAKNAVLVVAERELEFEAKLRSPSSVTSRPATDPSKCSEKRGVFGGLSSLVRQNRRADVRQPRRNGAAP
jgi:hypothetical protein